ncbi:MAG TPA: aminotransferase class III-fold pyridoxal phosphate-dependent enzyme [Cyclobacteriaceae bacterium]|nr:aminotransferase class III-fold pyridoxal phosphate-dependent enzyme [Cyclobacteriaceae bacterium]HPW64427.1 aminotransferase class III-fold pyridoxal phosphate-dependent enzyme [Cyclobacteriaceae bacterium]
MKLFDVYPLFPIEPVKASGSWLWDSEGKKYLDLYGGHAVISIGHNHPHFVEALKNQLDKISFYSNSVKNSLQEKLAEKLGQLSGYPNHQLFLCNSGAEANENALKLASFVTGRKKVIAFKKAFHGRTSGAVAATDNPKIVAPFNAGHDILFLPLNDVKAFTEAINKEIAAVIIEGIQGVGGIQLPDDSFLRLLSAKCKEVGALLILDEVQSGYGRSGKFFAHQYAGIEVDLITTAKGMGNGFPVGGVLIHPTIKPWSGMLGTTFGGNYLACAAALSVLEVIEQEDLMTNATTLGNYWMEQLRSFTSITEVRGKGLMIGFDLPDSLASLRKDLLFKHHIFTGEAKPNTVRLLPSLALTKNEADILLEALSVELKKPVLS